MVLFEKPIFVILFLFSNCFYLILCQVSNIVSVPCPSQFITSVPQVFVYNASDYDANIGTTPNYDTNGSVTFKTDGSEIIRLGIECLDNRPIQWIFDADFVSNGFREIHTNCSRDVKGHFNHTENYEYMVRYELQLNDYDKPFVFICERISNHCNRRVVFSSKLNNSGEEYNVKLLEKRDENLNKNVLEFDKQLLSTNWKDDLECVVKLTLSADIERLFYYWDPPDYQQPFNVLDPQSFNNYFRFVQPQEKECTEYTDNPEDLPCMKENKCLFVEHGGRPQVIYYAKGEQQRVIKGFFDLTEDENFYLPWDQVSPLDFVHINAPTEAYVSQEVDIECHASPVLLAHGTLIGWKPLQDSSYHFSSSQQENIFLSETGTRNITGKIRLTRSSWMEKEFPEFVNVSCFAPIWNSTEWIIKSQPIYLLESMEPIVNSSRNYEEEGYSFSCEASGIPIPTLEIIPPKENLNLSKTMERIDNSSVVLTVSFPKMDMNYEGTYNCVGTSIIGTASSTFNVTFPTREISPFLKTTLLISGAILIIFLLIVFGLLGKLVKDKEDYNRKKKQAIRDFQLGFPDDAILSKIADLQYDYKKYEVPIEQFDIGGTLLGSGAFGKVFKGYLRTDHGKKLIAIKMVNSPSNVEDFKTTLIELTIMSYLGNHENIVSLVAACVQNLERASLIIGIEYCKNGSLDSYLTIRRPLFHNFIKDGKLNLEDVTCQGPYINIIATANFSTLDLYKFSYQIANGMDYLRSMKVIHCDLGTRNVLISQDKVAKISDFGLSRALTQSSDYTKKSKVQLPWKYMAPESLRHLQFSSMSDVWSFGVTMWEIFSLGDKPWPNECWTTEYMDELDQGRRLPQPKYCTNNTFNSVILECWRNEPEGRISFQSSRNYFEEVIVALSSCVGSSNEFLSTC